MTRCLYAFALPLLLAAGPAKAQTRSARLVANVSYEAKGSGPDWQLAVGDRIWVVKANDIIPKVIRVTERPASRTHCRCKL